MPVYDFKCDICGEEQHDIVLKITHTKEDTPLCCGERMQKAPSRVTGIFKGSGFHAVDYRAPTRGF